MGERVLKLADCSPGGLEQLRRVVNGMACEIEESKRVQMLAALNAEIESQYARIEREVPGWSRHTHLAPQPLSSDEEGR